MLENNDDVLFIDEDSEKLAHVMTLVMKQLNSTIDLGATYEIVLQTILETYYESYLIENVEDKAQDVALAILATSNVKSDSKH